MPIVQALLKLVSDEADVMVTSADQGLRVIALKHDTKAMNSSAERIVPASAGQPGLLAALNELASALKA